LMTTNSAKSKRSSSTPANIAKKIEQFDWFGTPVGINYKGNESY